MMTVAIPSPHEIPRVLFEDTHLIVISKPAGLLSQGEITGDANVVDWLRGHFGRNYVGLVHRLDRNTSGVMVVAKRTKSANRLTEALQKGEMERTYLAWIHGELKAPARWSHVLVKDTQKNIVRVAPRATGKEAKPAVLLASPVARGRWQNHSLTLARFELETGRSHQIRVQSAYERHPLLGDPKYGINDGFPRTALHSHTLVFPHPMSQEVLTFEDPLPADLLVISRN